jgi:hypothetical protein
MADKTLKGTLNPQPQMSQAQAFGSLMRKMSRDTYDKQAKSDVKYSSMAGVGAKASDVSGGTFSAVMGALESMRGTDIAKEYSAGIEDYKTAQAEKDKQRAAGVSAANTAQANKDKAMSQMIALTKAGLPITKDIQDTLHVDEYGKPTVQLTPYEEGFNQTLLGKKGTDGYTDPDVYLKMKDEYTKHIGENDPDKLASASLEFDSKFSKLLDPNQEERYAKMGIKIDKEAVSQLNDTQQIAQAIINGEQPPVLTGLYGKSAAVRAELAKKGFDLSQASQDWDSTKRYLATINGPAQVRLRQAVNFAYESLPIVEDLSQQWKRNNYPALNKVQLEAAKQGALGPEAQSIATQLDSQISDMVSELATVYKGGNSATDDSLAQASKMLSSSWSEKTLTDNIALIKKNLAVRQSSIKNSGVVSTGDTNQYAPTPAQDTADVDAWLGTVDSPEVSNYLDSIGYKQ